MPADDFNEVLSRAIEDMLANGFDSMERVDRWTRELRSAAERSLITPASLEQMLRDGLAQVYRKMVEKGDVVRYAPGVERFTLEKLKPALRSELDRRIMASADLIKLNRRQSIDKTLQRFQGWSTSIPPGGVSGETRPEVRKTVRKALAQLPFEERRVLIDQGHKLTASISSIVAADGGAIAGLWRSHWRQAGYDYREDHKERDGQVYLVRDSWAHQAGLVKKGPAGYTDDVTQPAQEPFCRCFYRWIFNLRDLPGDMLTAKGKATLERVRGQEDVRSARFSRADEAQADGEMNVSNAGISHMGKRGNGSEPACGNRRAISTYAKDQFRALPPDTQCKRCLARLERWDAIRAKTGRADSEDVAQPHPLPCIVDRDTEVPGVAALSHDGRKLFLDRRVPRMVEVMGRQIDPAQILWPRLSAEWRRRLELGSCFLDSEERRPNEAEAQAMAEHDSVRHAGDEAERQAARRLQVDVAAWTQWFRRQEATTAFAR